MMAFISRLSILKKTMKENKNCIIITERSLFTDKFVFAQMLFDKGKIEDVNFKIYLEWFNELYAINSHSPKKLNDVYDPIWNILHINLSGCFAFQKLINFFLNGTPPSADLR
jgi:hypothetical protein